MNDNHIPRSVRRGDYWVICVELLHNLIMAVENFTESLLEVAIYSAERETKISHAQDALSKDLEKLQEE